MKNPILYIILNGELKMSPGKAAAQAVHASMMLNGNSKSDFMSDYKRTVIVLEAKNAEQIKNLYNYLDADEILDADYYIDEGRNEVDAYSVTALAIGPIAYDDIEKREMFEAFPLFHGEPINHKLVTICYLEQLKLDFENWILSGNEAKKIDKVLKLL